MQSNVARFVSAPGDMDQVTNDGLTRYQLLDSDSDTICSHIKPALYPFIWTHMHFKIILQVLESSLHASSLHQSSVRIFKAINIYINHLLSTKSIDAERSLETLVAFIDVNLSNTGVVVEFLSKWDILPKRNGPCFIIMTDALRRWMGNIREIHEDVFETLERMIVFCHLIQDQPDEDTEQDNDIQMDQELLSSKLDGDVTSNSQSFCQPKLYNDNTSRINSDELTESDVHMATECHEINPSVEANRIDGNDTGPSSASHEILESKRMQEYDELVPSKRSRTELQTPAIVEYMDVIEQGLKQDLGMPELLLVQQRLMSIMSLVHDKMTLKL